MKKFLLSLLAIPVFSLALVTPALAQNEPINNPEFWGGEGVAGEDIAGNINDGIILGTRDPREIAAQVVNIILGFLGIIAVIIILAGGFRWMTAGGNQDKVDEAKKLMSAGVIGLIIVLAAFGIARFIIDSLVSATITS